MQIAADPDELARRGWLRVVMERHESRRCVMLTAVKPVEHERQHVGGAHLLKLLNHLVADLDRRVPPVGRLAEAPTVDSYREAP